MAMQNIFSDLPKSLVEEHTDQLLHIGNVKVERIVSMGHSSPQTGWYDQDSHEWVIVLQGQAILSFEGEADVHMCPGDFIHLPPHKRHKVNWTDPNTETIWLAVHFA